MLPKALIVEDEADTGEILGAYLRRWGFDPTLLLRGQPAIPWAHEHQPALILLDLMLPDIAGYDVCRELKLNRATSLVPILMMTGQEGPEGRVHGLQVGANGYLTKPFSELQLREAINEVLAWREQLETRGSQGEILFHLRSDTRYLDQLNQLLASLFHFTPLLPAQVHQLMTAVRELGSNAIEWGHRNQTDRIVTVSYHIDSEKVTIVIRDTGMGFDPTSLPHAAHEDDPIAHLDVRAERGLREGGFGIMLARGLVDHLEYNTTGNEVRLVKFFAPPPQVGGQPQR